METIKLSPDQNQLQDPRPFIHGIIGEILSFGGNDYEAPHLYKIIQDFENKKITATEAINLAQKIRDHKEKNNYH